MKNKKEMKKIGNFLPHSNQENLKIRKIIFLIILFALIIFLQNLSAMNISSENYSVKTAGIGLLVSNNTSSSNYQAVSLLEAKGTTRNADSGTYTTNIGFFENTSYSRTVSISSAQTTTTGGSSKKGEEEETIIQKCTYLWNCTSWGLCVDGKQKRECKNTGTCNGNESKPIEEMLCSQSLFDISLKLKNIKLTQDKTLRFNIDLTEKIGVEKIDIYIKYTIIDKNNEEIFSQIETKAIQGKLSYEKEIEDIKLKDGEYTLRTDIFYGYQQIASAEQRFKLTNGKIILGVKQKLPDFFFNKTIYLSIAITLLIFTGIFSIIKISLYRKRRGIDFILKDKIKYIFILIGIIILNILDYKLGLTDALTLTGKTVFLKITEKFNLLFVIGFVLAIILALFILTIIKKIREIIEKLKDKFLKKYPCNSIKGLVGKEVYSSDGYKRGKVQEIYLDGKNPKIYGLLIKLDKKIAQKIKRKGILVEYKFVNSVKDIVLIDERIFEWIN